MVPGIHAFLGAKTWMAGTSPAMTTLVAGSCLNSVLSATRFAERRNSSGRTDG
jgi:hypothetical protein